MTPSACTLDVVFARDAPVAVIFRRGPSKSVRMIKWDTTRDHFEPGQWFKGSVYPTRAALSPSGRLLIYFAGDFRWHREARGTWTAVSKPPYFTALHLWPQGDTWGGGGWFEDENHVVVNGRVFQLRPRVEALDRDPTWVEADVGTAGSPPKPSAGRRAWTARQCA